MFCKKGVLRISQNLQESICARASFLINFIKKETLAQVFSCEFCELSKNTFLQRTPLMTASECLTWFQINSMKANPEKFQFMILSKTRRPEYNLLIDSNVIKESADMELLRLIINNKLSFEKHIAR